jgi:hypothetical protein
MPVSLVHRGPHRRASLSALALACALAGDLTGALVPAAAAATPVAPEPRPLAAQPHARVAVRELQVDGAETSTSPALVLQLQDGFGVGLTRAGVSVLDSVDVARALQDHPELARCDTALCVKRLGEVLDVRYLIQPRVTVTGNSYRMTARLFRTDGQAPMLPIDTQSRFCDVCTVAEAREVMIKLADSIRRPLDEPQLTATSPASTPPAAPSLLPKVALGAGLVSLLAGTTVLLAASHDGKALPALGGALMGAGLTVAGIGVYLMVEERREAPTVGVAATGTF